jgi:hypothetical protein
MSISSIFDNPVFMEIASSFKMDATHTTKGVIKDKIPLYRLPHDSPSMILGLLKDNTQLQVVREMVNRDFVEVRVVDPSLPAFKKVRNRFFYVLSTDMVPTPELMPFLLDKVYIKSEPMTRLEKATIPNWVKFTKPYYHKERLEYWVTAKTSYTCIESDSVLRKAKNEAIKVAIKDLFKYYNVYYNQETEEEINKFASAFLGAFVHDYHLEPRPGSKLKILVRIRAIYFEWLKRFGPQLRKTNLEDLPKAAHVTILEPGQWDSNIKKTSKILAGAALDMQRENVHIPGVNFMREAKRVRAFVPELKRLLIANGVDPDGKRGRPYKVEIGYDEEYRLLYTAIRYEDRGPRRTRAGYNIIKDF